MKKYIAIAFLATIGLMATDFSTYSAEDLAAMRGTIAAEDQTAFQDALQAALADLSTEERQAIMSKKSNTASGVMSQTRSRNSAMEAIGSGMAKSSGVGVSAGGMGAGGGGMGGGGAGGGGGHGGPR